MRRETAEAMKQAYTQLTYVLHRVLYKCFVLSVTVLYQLHLKDVYQRCGADVSRAIQYASSSSRGYYCRLHV